MAGGLTVGGLWEWLAHGPVSDEWLEWAPDIAACTSVLLQRSQAFRFVVSPPQPGVWPPPGERPFSERVRDAASEWRRAMDAGTGAAPTEVKRYWRSLTDRLDIPLADLAEGHPWELCEAALALHAIADETCAMGAVDGPAQGPGSIFRARARELLARTGSMSRLPADRVAHLPKSRTTSVGITHRSLSRYTSTTTEGIGVVWDRIPAPRPGSGPADGRANVLLLPWPLRIEETDFVPVPGSVRRPTREPFGFFTYEPSEPLDLELVDRLLATALEEAGGVDVVVLPEGCVDEQGVEALEAVLARHGVTMLVTGLRPQPAAPDRFPLNCLHTGVRFAGRWWHYRQNKHHRWFLDAGQIRTYDIAGALDPSVRWWEAMEIPERSVHVLELGRGMSVAAVVCEDLARLDGVAELLRSVGPTLVVTLLLDGPQLASRWTSRYAGVLADDPGSAVLTLTPLGMATRSHPAGRPPSRVIAMWKDPSRGLREIPLEPGAQGVLLTTVIGPAARYAADGREPADDATDFSIAGVHQLRAHPRATGAEPRPSRGGSGAAELAPTDLTILSTWAQAVADAVPDGPDAFEAVLASARPDATWRTRAGLPQPTGRLAEALDALVAAARSGIDRPPSSPVDEGGVESVARASLVAALEAAPRA